MDDFREDFEPDLWGPHAWAFLHTVTFSYPDSPHPELQQQMRDFFWNLRVALPCRKCRRHYEDSFVALEGSQPFRNKKALTQWLVEVHNRVNDSHNKPQLTLQQAERIYTARDRLCGTRAVRRKEKRRLSVLGYVLALLLVMSIAIAAVLQSCRTC